MNEKFLCGIILGMIGGALIVTNSVKAKNLVEKGQDQVTQKITETLNKKKKNK